MSAQQARLCFFFLVDRKPAKKKKKDNWPPGRPPILLQGHGSLAYKSCGWVGDTDSNQGLLSSTCFDHLHIHLTLIARMTKVDHSCSACRKEGRRNEYCSERLWEWPMFTVQNKIYSNRRALVVYFPSRRKEADKWLVVEDMNLH